uniref:Bacteriophage protein n=1 Tax=Mesocestoides corti TaxID=53468 RepID=A0A5K3FZC0_MESCO
MLAKLQRIVTQLFTRLKATSNGEEVDAICTAIRARGDAYNALRCAGSELEMAN